MKRCLFLMLALAIVLLSSFTAPSNFIDLSKSGTANCYIVSKSGYYKFHAVKGNSTVSVGSVSSVAVLWESYGTDVNPSVGALIKKVAFNKGYIAFQTADKFKEGNAVIAAKDASGKILWSWHIWLTDQPKGQVYYNNAGTMMDRNLGATSATPGDVGALGLLYQWGRKDPFLGSSSISDNVVAKSTITWPSTVVSGSSTGTIAYATANPTTFITYNDKNYDWYYTGSSSTNNTRWTTSESSKSIYDPCPAGWRVPDGGDNGVWSKAFGGASDFYDESLFNSTNEGMNFSGKFGSASTIWYPASGCRQYDDGGLYYVGYIGTYWSASPFSDYAYCLSFDSRGVVLPSNNFYRAVGRSVRCVKEDSLSPAPYQHTHQSDLNISSATDLSSSGSANCYIVSKSGTYKFKTVKGNSSTPIGSVCVAETLWETFGTSTTPSIGDLVSAITYKDGYIAFQTANTFKEGNAVIAAKDANGIILWSWHIWFTDQPKEQVYYNNAGTMMDRNLGATSATPGDVGALGLLYQWGRKDPFLGSSSISSSTLAKSTIAWPLSVSSNSSNGTIEYATAHPTTFITNNSSNYDWYYTGDSSTDNTRWTTSDKAKSIYDPCPSGWRVPDGGDNGVWSKALGSSSGFNYTYDGTNEGMNFSGKYGSASTIWYLASGYRYHRDGSLLDVGSYGGYWSASPGNNGACDLYFSNDGYVGPSGDNGRANGPSVRCVKDTHQSDLNISSATDLSSSGSANCYIVSKSGTYKFKTVKGNSSTPVGSVCVAETLWETFGTSTTPSIGDLVSAITYKDGYIAFQTANTFKEGNAVIAAKDAYGKILWSWHIWFTDQPQGQEYYNNAGTMMDRNLGATSATPGDVGALGLLYQWGRKDPFLGSSSISSNTMAKSTVTWPSAVSSDSSTGTIAYATANPTTFIKYNNENGDWYYTGSSSTDNTRWTTSENSKSIYDPCPAGWRVPDGASKGVWSKALGSLSYTGTYNSTNEGINFSGKFGSASTIWYPALGYRSYYESGLYEVGDYGYYWSASPGNNGAYSLCFGYSGYVSPSNDFYRADGFSVRCVREDSLSPAPYQHPPQSDLNISSATDLSSSGSANCYIVSKSGTYKFKTVKGNSSTPVGSVCVAETLWETFGTSTTPSIGDLVSAITYKDGYVAFQTADTFKEGNAVIAAKDVDGNILWSWHIWFTDQPQGQEYYNNAGVMMDRNLGATSTTPGDVGALGLLYQWGRKDPFLGSSSISGNVEAKSTITWPSPASSDSSTGTIAYATANPTTFIKCNSKNYDWYYTGSSSTDNTRWTTSESSKSIYDPCPAGWRVPDGGDNGVWSKAKGFSSNFDHTYSSTNEGMNFSGKYGGASSIWYPASGFRSSYVGSLNYLGDSGLYWSASPGNFNACLQEFNDYGYVYPSYDSNRAIGQSVRCVKEDSLSPAPHQHPPQSNLNISSAPDLSSSGSANCYIVSKSGTYKFKTVKGNSSAPVGSVCVAETLWETFGTSTTPSIGDLVSAITYKDGYIAFQTANTFKEGNAVIAAKDANGDILWSWHIWFTDQPQGQVYYNGAGTMMDRNLGATSATPGDVGALGLLYQWGRKDPFLGSSSISSSTLAKSTITWPSTVVSGSSTGTIAYATANPTTFIGYNNENYDWYYTGSSSTDNSRWTISTSSKSIYDPCPAGWRVPDGGDNGVWSKALGSSSYFTQSSLYDSINEGMNFSGKFGSASTIWYPASGCRFDDDGSLHNVGYNGNYWSASPYNNSAYMLSFYGFGRVGPYGYARAYGCSVRCVKDTHQSDLNISSATDLSSSGSANCYIVSKSGTYKFKTVKGNSSTPVGSVCVAETLWETFGTSTTPSIGDLVSAITYKDGYVAFQTANTFKEGNAVIAAKDAYGKILWSWHIWFTDQPKEQVYYNNAGTMMDRNLGATSATPGDAGALGLLYQWGRKDPFLGSSSISGDVEAESTISWHATISSNSSNGTIAYATANPTTFIRFNIENKDWYYTGSSSTDNTRWTTSESSKSIYDPCPAGWRVPDGGSNGIWSKALGSSVDFNYSYDGTNEGMNFSGKFGSDQTIWYPASGSRPHYDGCLASFSFSGIYWSASPYDYNACGLNFNYIGRVFPSDGYYRADGRSVRCVRE